MAKIVSMLLTERREKSKNDWITLRGRVLCGMSHHACKLLQGTFLLNCTFPGNILLFRGTWSNERPKYGNVTEYFMRRSKVGIYSGDVWEFTTDWVHLIHHHDNVIFFPYEKTPMSEDFLIVKYNITNASAQCRYWPHWYDMLWKVIFKHMLARQQMGDEICYVDQLIVCWWSLSKVSCFRNFPKKEMFT